MTAGDNSDALPKGHRPLISPENDRTVCFCHCVSLSRILEAIQTGAVTFEQLQSDTSCSTGCGGCEWDVREILEEELSRSSEG